MSWSLFRWAWQLEGLLHVGMPPAGSLNRTRLYVPASALWGALTAELSRQEAQNGKEPQYQRVGESLQKDYRFTYLFPAEKVEASWQAWLPIYHEALGLAWSREDQQERPPVGDRQFRRRLLSTRAGTAIDASTDAAADGSLRETECIEARWRDGDVGAGPVAMVGYVFLRTAKAKDKYPPEQRRLHGIDTLFVGGDTRYGLGRLRRVACNLVSPRKVFGSDVTIDADVPQIESSTAWAHARVGASLHGALELLGGWDRGSIRSLDPDATLWQPGSQTVNSHTLTWLLEPDGSWRAMT